MITQIRDSEYEVIDNVVMEIGAKLTHWTLPLSPNETCKSYGERPL